MRDLPGTEPLDFDDIPVMKFAAAGRFDLAVALDAAFGNQGLRFSAGSENTGPFEELVELDFFGVNGDFFNVHDNSFLLSVAR